MRQPWHAVGQLCPWSSPALGLMSRNFPVQRAHSQCHHGGVGLHRKMRSHSAHPKSLSRTQGSVRTLPSRDFHVKPRKTSKFGCARHRQPRQDPADTYAHVARCSEPRLPRAAAAKKQEIMTESTVSPRDLGFCQTLLGFQELSIADFQNSESRLFGCMCKKNLETELS